MGRMWSLSATRKTSFRRECRDQMVAVVIGHVVGFLEEDGIE